MDPAFGINARQNPARSSTPCKKFDEIGDCAVGMACRGSFFYFFEFTSVPKIKKSFNAIKMYKNCDQSLRFETWCAEIITAGGGNRIDLIIS